MESLTLDELIGRARPMLPILLADALEMAGIEQRALIEAAGFGQPTVRMLTRWPSWANSDRPPMFDATGDVGVAPDAAPDADGTRTWRQRPPLL
jgi:hypothetical protein